jgi:hypothetical protein
VTTTIAEVPASQLVVLMERLHRRDKSGQCESCQVEYPCATIVLLDGCDIIGDWAPDDAHLEDLRQVDRDARAGAD